MSVIPQRKAIIPPTATATFTPQNGWGRPTSTTMGTSPYVGGILPIDRLVGVSSALLSFSVASISAGSNASSEQHVPFPDLPAITPQPNEQAILLVSADTLHAITHLNVSSIDAIGHVLPANSTVPVHATYLAAGLALSAYSAHVTLFLQTDGSNCAGGTAQIRANGQLYVRRLTGS